MDYAALSNNRRISDQLGTFGRRRIHVHVKPATGRPYVREFSLSGTVPAFTCDCLRFVCAFTPRPKVDLCVSTSSRTIDSIHGQRNPHRERGLAGMGNGCFAEFCCCVPLCPCELRYSSSKDIPFHRFPGDKVAGRECIFKSRRDMPLL